MSVGSDTRGGWLHRMVAVGLVGGLFVVSLAACGKKGAPVAPEDAPPAKQESR